MAEKKSTRPFGNQGEQLAASHLQHQGYTIVAQNWHCQYGEIDIIARQGETLVFVEVRTRHARLTETAFESITERKQARLVRAVQVYLAQHNLEDGPWRVDVIAIAVPPSGSPVIDHITDALDW
ncbi:MAG TPA: YraN family protein [Phototrophicaceae bacterium]|nr:YraN family protein [Phototrophicaceae bacterium]